MADSPKHALYRKLVVKAFKVAGVASDEAIIQMMTDALEITVDLLKKEKGNIYNVKKKLPMALLQAGLSFTNLGSQKVQCIGSVASFFLDGAAVWAELASGVGAPVAAVHVLLEIIPGAYDIYGNCMPPETRARNWRGALRFIVEAQNNMVEYQSQYPYDPML